jgi:hypothetical protein
MSTPSKTPSLITPDWTRNREPFYLKAERKEVNGATLVLPDRYAIGILTDEEKVGDRSDLQDKMDAHKDDGKRKLLEHYDKMEGQTPLTVYAEGWKLPIRPNAKLVVLISVPSEEFDALLSTKQQQLGLPKADKEISLNTKDISTKINKLKKVVSNYEQEVKDIFGKVPRLRLMSQVNKLDNFIPALGKLMLDNGYVYDKTEDRDLIFGISSDYKPKYMLLNNGDCYKPLDDSFSNFAKSPAASNQRTLKLIENMDAVGTLLTNAPAPEEGEQQKTKLSLGDFVDKYIFDPPSFDFSSNPPKSPPESRALQEAKKKKPTAKTYSDYTAEERLFGSKEMRKELEEKLEAASEFVGDNIIANLRELSNLTPTVNELYGKVLNKAPLRAIIEQAMECLGFRGLELLQISKQFLNMAERLAGEIKNTLFDIPTVNIPDDFPIVDYLQSIGKQILQGVIDALLSTLFRVVIELLKMLLDFCKECALQNETAGRGRFDGFNFGGLNLNNALGVGAASFTSAALGAIQTGVVNAQIDLPDGKKTSVAQQQMNVIEQTEQFAQNPLLIPGVAELTGQGDKDYVGDPELQERLRRDANEAKEQMTGFLNGASSVLTPAEAGNMMLGCGVSQEAIDAVKNLAKRFPAIPIQSDEDVTDFFENIGKFTGYENVLNLVKEVTDNIPEEFICLCDPDDAVLREALLKDKGMDEELIKEQIEESKKRENQRLIELNDLLQKDNILDGVLPPTYCTIDPKGNIVPGLIKNDHPKFDFTLDSTLNTVYDGIAGAFNRDVTSYLPTVSISPTQERVVPRTITRNVRIGGETKQIVQFNNEFLDLINKGVYSFGALPPLATSNVDITNRGAITEVLGFFGSLFGEEFNPPRKLLNGDQVKTKGASEPTFINVTWLGAEDEIEENYGYDDFSPNDPEDVIAMDRPFPESEKKYEEENLALAAISRKGKAGRYDPQDYFTVKYGYSPVPITIKEKGPQEFAPGYKENFKTFCFKSDKVDQRFTILTSNQSELYRFNVPNNLLQNLNIDIEQLKTIEPGFLSAEDNRGQGIDESALNRSFESVQKALAQVQNSSFNLNYYVPWNYTEGKEQYVFGITLDPAKNAGPYADTSLPLNVQSDLVDINPGAMTVFTERSLNIQNEPQNHTPQERFFKQLLIDCMENGPALYSVRQKITDKPSYMKGVFAPDPRAPQFFEQALKETENRIYNSDLYNEVWRDIFCSFPQQIGADSNPYFSLDNLFSLNMTPMRIDGEDDCPPHLLDIDAVKRRIKEEYSLIQCLEASFPNTDGLGSNKSNPFEKANLGGTVLLIIRTYVMEVMLRSLQVFYWFRYKTPGDVDELFVQWLARFLTADIENKGYFEEFETEVLDLYNRNIDLEVDEDGNRITVEDYDAAIKFLVRQQIYSVSNRLSRLVGSKGDISLDSILLEEWLPTIDVPAGNNEDRFSNPPKTAKDDLNYASEDLIKIFFKGELSEYRIKSMNGDSGIASRQNQYENILYQRPIGQFFREYYGANVDQANNILFSSIRNPNVPNESIWSKNISPENEAFPKLNYGNEGNSQFTDNAENPLANVNREQGMLGISSFLGSLGTTNETIKQRGADLQWTYFKNNIFPKPSNQIQYRLGVSQPEIDGMDTVVKFVAAAARPELFEQEGYSFKFGGRNSQWYFPGWSLRQIKKSEKTDTLHFKPNYGFSYIFGDLAKEYGIPPAEDENGPRFDWWTFEANEYVYEARQAKQEGKDEEEVERVKGDGGVLSNLESSEKTYFPPPDPNQKPDSLNKMNSRVRDRMKEFIENGYFGPDRLNYRTEPNPDLDTFGYGDPEGTNIRVWSGDPNYVKFGEFKTGRGEPFQEALITNPQSRYVKINVPGLGEQTFGPFVFAFIDDNYARFTSNSFDDWYQFAVSLYQDPWKYKGPERKVVVPEIPTVNLNGETIPWSSPAPGTKTVLNPNGNRGDAHVRLFNHAYAMLEKGNPYISIMDFDLLSIQNILEYEKQYFEEQKEKALSEVSQRIADINFNSIIEKYDNWINEIKIARGKFAQAQPEREKIRKQFVEKALAKQPRRPMETPLTLDFKNGGLILEPYIRVTRLDPNADYEDKQGAKANIDLVSSEGDEYLEDIVNIDKFQDFLDKKFGGLTGYQKIKIKNQPIPDNIVKVCGGDLPIQSPNDKSDQPLPSELTLGDFFDNLSLGMRLSYVAPIEEGTQDSFFEPLIGGEGDEGVIDSSKAYLENGSNTIPIVSTEIPFNMNITIKQRANWLL